MQTTFQRLLLSHPITRPSLGNPARYALRAVRAVVIHWTANTAKGANARRNRDYFNNGSINERGLPRAASAHYVVDDRTVIQCLPETEVGFHCGDKPLGRYKPLGLALMNGYKGLTPNYFTIGIEMCVNADGNWDFTYENTVALTAEMLLRHGLSPETGLCRHFDVTGKACPKPMLSDAAWHAFCLVVAMRMQILQGLCLDIRKVGRWEVNVRSGPSAKHEVLYSLLPGERVFVYAFQGDWIQIGPGRWMNAIYSQSVIIPDAL